MRRLVYISVCQPLLTSGDVDDIVAVSSIQNQKDGVTGMLWFNGIHFSQVLEGDAEAITLTMRRIVKDSRHSTLEVISDGQADERLFGNWSMMRSDGDPQAIRNSMMLTR